MIFRSIVGTNEQEADQRSILIMRTFEKAEIIKVDSIYYRYYTC